MRVTGLPGLLGRVIYKGIIAPARYGSGAGRYDAERFWRDRFAKYGGQLRGSGHEGLSEAENRSRYNTLAGVISGILADSGIALSNCRVLDIGCGPGYFTGMLADMGVREYVGLDITDELFPILRDRFPQFHFIQADITSQAVSGKFNLVLMIDVLEHIVTEEGMAHAMATIREALSEEGLLVVGPAFKKNRRGFFYVRHWTEKDIRAHFQDYSLSYKRQVSYGSVLGLRAPKAPYRPPSTE